MKQQETSQGKVIEVLPGPRFKVEMEDGKVLICYLAGKMKLRKISVDLGNKVDVVVDPYGGTATNRIVWRR